MVSETCCNVVAGVQLCELTISLTHGNPSPSPWNFVFAVHVAHPSLRPGSQLNLCRELFQLVAKGGGLGFAGLSLSFRRRGARLNTSYSHTKGGCDVHTNEPIIGGFVTQFRLSLIWQTNPLCARVCAFKCAYMHISNIHACVLKSLESGDSTQPPLFFLNSPSLLPPIPPSA